MLRLEKILDAPVRTLDSDETDILALIVADYEKNHYDRGNQTNRAWNPRYIFSETTFVQPDNFLNNSLSNCFYVIKKSINWAKHHMYVPTQNS